MSDIIKSAVGYAELAECGLGDYKLPRASTALLVIDIQERLTAAMAAGEAVAARSRLMIEGAAVLGLPVLVTEQYPKGLGGTLPQLNEALERTEHRRFEKLSYSALVPELLAELERRAISHVLLCGMETHVCIWQTARDLLAKGYCVQLLSDAVCSRRDFDRETALAGLRDMGAVVSLSESALFDLLETAGTPEFKAISKLVR